MPTDAEKLAIAEEIAARFPPMRIQFKDFFVQHGGVRWYAYRGLSGLDTLASAEKLMDCVLAARQKLAAEREAARTPEERRLAAENEKFRIALKTIGQNCGLNACDPTCTNAARIARKALEGGA